MPWAVCSASWSFWVIFSSPMVVDFARSYHIPGGGANGVRFMTGADNARHRPCGSRLALCAWSVRAPPALAPPVEISPPPHPRRDLALPCRLLRDGVGHVDQLLGMLAVHDQIHFTSRPVAHVLAPAPPVQEHGLLQLFPAINDGFGDKRIGQRPIDSMEFLQVHRLLAQERSATGSVKTSNDSSR